MTATFRLGSFVLFFAFSVALDLFILLNGDLDFDTNDPLNAVIAYPFALVIVISWRSSVSAAAPSGPNRFGPDPLSGKT